MSGRWDKKEQKEPSRRLYYSIFGFGAGFIVGMIYTLIVLGMNI
jgi:hypothetical protein